MIDVFLTFKFALPLLLAVSISIFVHRYLSHGHTLRHLPGPPAQNWLFGNTIDLKRAPVGTRFNVWAKRYGHTYRLAGPLSTSWLILGDPKGSAYVLSGKNYVRPTEDRVALELFFGGRSLFCAEGDEHRKMRKILNGSFTFQSVRDVSHVVFDLAHRLKTQWEGLLDVQDAAPFNVASSIHMLTLDAISMTMFGHDLSTTEGMEGKIPELLHNISNSPGGDMETLMTKVFSTILPYLMKLPSPMKAWADNLRKELGSIAEDVWAGKRNAGSHAKLLDSLAEASKSGERPISKDEAVAQIIGILFAGSETTANVITECFYELSRQPKIQDELRRELISFEASQGREPTYEELMSATILPYLDKVTRETMRTKAVLMYISRAAVEDDTIPLLFPVLNTEVSEVRVKAGQLIQIPIRDGVNVDKEIWGPDAAEFRPERWLEEDRLPETVRLMHMQGHILTFGDGPKVCLGRIFALAEFKIVVSTIIRHFTLEPADGGVILDFYHLGGNTVKPLIRGREGEGVQMPLSVRRV